MCGAHRPGHFDGVATVVAKQLFTQVARDAAFSARRTISSFWWCVAWRATPACLEVVGVPTVREPDGLALSSRNVYLSADERRLAPNLNRSMRKVAAAIAGGAPPAAAVQQAIVELTGLGIRVEYLELRDAVTLTPLSEIPAAPAHLLAAVHLGKTRLIDNIPLAPV